MGNRSHGDYSHLASLDGLRAGLCFWVLLGHLTFAVGFHIPAVSTPAHAVDLFVVLSGFLMVYTWNYDNGASIAGAVLEFYIKRFFRIAPLFYLLLIVCFAGLGSFTSMENSVRNAIPPPWIVERATYHSQLQYDFANVKWFFLHSTFLFGVFESSSPLPDWSLSLEMQFYALFPFLLYPFKKINPLLTSTLLAALGALSPMLWGGYLGPGLLAQFGQPSLLPYRLNAFAAGMFVAFILRSREAKSGIACDNLILLVSALVCMMPLDKIVVLLFLLFVSVSLFDIPNVSWILRTRVMRFLGDISYSVYLSHVLVITSVVYWLLRNTSFLHKAPVYRFLWAAAIVLPLTTLISFLLYRLVERPSIRVGRLLISKMAIVSPRCLG